LVVILAILVVRGPSTDAPAAPPLRSTTSTTLSPEAEVEQAYRAFDAMLARLSPAPDPSDPEIAQLTTGEFRARLERVLADRRARGLAVKLGPEDGPLSVDTRVTSGSAVVKACYVDQAVTVNVETGANVDAMRTVREFQTLTLVREQGTWKVRRLVVERKPGTEELAPCDG
jgi:hypothetical protein